MLKLIFNINIIFEYWVGLYLLILIFNQINKDYYNYIRMWIF